MSQSDLNRFDLANLNTVADYAREHVADGMSRVGVALGAHPAFGTYSRPKSSLVRALVLDGVTIGAKSTGLQFADDKDTVTLSLTTGTHLRLFRVLKATRRKDGSYNVPRNGSSAWGAPARQVLDVAQDWVMGFTLEEETDGLGDLFAAQVLAVEGGLPGKFTLGEHVLLGSGPISPTGSFAGDDQDMLPGFESPAAPDEQSL